MTGPIRHYSRGSPVPSPARRHWGVCRVGCTKQLPDSMGGNMVDAFENLLEAVRTPIIAPTLGEISAFAVINIEWLSTSV